MQTKQGAIHDAIKTYKEAISIDPQNPEPHWNYSLTLLLSGNFQAEDGIRDAQESRGLGDVYKRQLPRLI